MTEKRQLVLLNNRFLDRFGIPRKENFLGLRPGNVIDCLHSGESSLGCGTASACQNCPVIHAMFKAIDSKSLVTEQVYFEMVKDEEVRIQHFLITILPYMHINKYFYLIYLEPINPPLH